MAPPGAPGLRQGTVAGTRVDKPVSLLDIYPTLVDLCGLTPREGLSGQSLVPLMADPGATWTRPSLMTHGRLNHAIRTDRWRYIRYADGSEELYDHDTDPFEHVNLAGRAEFATVKRELANWLPKDNAPDAPYEKTARPAAKAKTNAGKSNN